jgi:hypothetical protein
MAEEGIKYSCDLCGDLIEIGRTRYKFHGELTAAYDGAEFDETYSGSKYSLKSEIERLIKHAESKTEKELTDEVYYTFKMDVCTKCRNRLYRILEQKKDFEIKD